MFAIAANLVSLLQAPEGQTLVFRGLQVMSRGPAARGSRARDEKPASTRNTGFSLSTVFSTVLVLRRPPP